MDKITRLLLIYSRLIQGEKLNKAQFCIEADCSLRAFDRDIEDIRLFLSETFAYSEILYDRKNNEYSMSNNRAVPFDLYEFFLIERLLLKSQVLRSDEMEILLEHLVGNTERGYLQIAGTKNRLSLYETEHIRVPLMKLHGDLTGCINRNRVIRIIHQENTPVAEEMDLIPIDIQLDSKYLYLVAFRSIFSL